MEGDVTPPRTSSRLAKKQRHSGKPGCPCCVKEIKVVSSKRIQSPDAITQKTPGKINPNGTLRNTRQTLRVGSSDSHDVDDSNSQRRQTNTRHEAGATHKRYLSKRKKRSGLVDQIQPSSATPPGNSNDQKLTNEDEGKSMQPNNGRSLKRRRGRPRKETSQTVTIIVVKENNEETRKSLSENGQFENVIATDGCETNTGNKSTVDPDDMLVQAMCKVNSTTKREEDRTMIYDAVSALLNVRDIKLLDELHCSWERELLTACPVRLADCSNRKIIISPNMDVLHTAHKSLLQMLKTVTAETVAQMKPSSDQKQSNTVFDEKIIEQSWIETDSVKTPELMESCDTFPSSPPSGSPAEVLRSLTGEVATECVDAEQSLPSGDPVDFTLLNKACTENLHRSEGVSTHYGAVELDPSTVVESFSNQESSEINLDKDEVDVSGSNEHSNMRNITDKISKAQRTFKSMNKAGKRDILYTKKQAAVRKPGSVTMTESKIATSRVDGSNSASKPGNLQGEEADRPMNQEDILALVKKLENDLLVEEVDPREVWKMLVKPYTRSAKTNKKVVTDNDLILCDLCAEYRGTEAAILSHKRRCHPKVIYRCDKCNKPFGLKTACLVHRLSHLGRERRTLVARFLKKQKKSQDDDCVIQHINMDQLDKNMSRGNTTLMKNPQKANYNCTFCSYHGTQVGLSTHMLRYHPKKVYKCGECGKSFGTSYQMNVHRDSHAMKRLRSSQKIEAQQALLHLTKDGAPVSMPDEFKKIHVCDICGFTTTKMALTQHKLRHHGKKGLQCDLCYKWFVRKCELSAHRSSHFDNEGHLRKIRKVNNTLSDDSNQFMLSTNGESDSHDVVGAETQIQSVDVEGAHVEDKLYTCNVCGFQTTFHGLRVHKRRKHKEKKFDCDICCKKFHLSSQLQKHRVSHFSETGELKQWEKDKCGLGGDQSVKCDECDVVFTNKRALEIHISKKHNRVKKYMCEYCLYKGFTKNDVEIHVARRHRSHDHKCEICGKMYAFAKELERHQTVIHKGLEQCKCHICGQEFKMIRYLKTHMERHEGKFRCYCTTCGKGFMDTCRLKEHEHTHKPMDKREFLYHCEICRKGFIRKTTWSQHLDCHFQNRRHVCKICGKRFTLPQTLSKHKMRHKKEKPYPCTYPGCNKQFIDRTTFQYHYVTHTGESSHQCVTCGKYFTQAATLRRHVCRKAVHKLQDEINTSSANQIQPRYENAVSILKSNHPAEEAIIIKPEQLELLTQLENQGQTLEILEGPDLTENITIILSQDLAEKQETDIQTDNVMIVLSENQNEDQKQGEAMEAGENMTVILNEVQEEDACNVKMEGPAEQMGTEQFLCSVCEQLFQTWSEIESHMLLHTDADSNTTLSIIDPSIEMSEVVTPDLDEIEVKSEVSRSEQQVFNGTVLSDGQVVFMSDVGELQQLQEIN